MKTVGSNEVRTHLPQLLDEVARGATITITRRGVPVARLTPVKSDKPDFRSIIKMMQDYSNQQNRMLCGTTIRELIEEGRRY